MINKTLVYFLLVLLVFLLLVWIFSNIVSYFVIAIILSTICTPLTNRINQLHIFGMKIPRFIAIIISFAVIIGIVSLFVVLFIPLITEQISIINTLDYDELYNNVTVPLQNVENFFIDNNLTDQPEGFIVDNLRTNLLSIIQSLNFSVIINELISFTGNFFIGLLAVVFITFILLHNKGILRRQIIKLIPNQYFEVFIVAIYKIEILLSNYLIGILLQVFSIFCIASMGLSIVGVKYALTIAIFAAVANLIPYAGPTLGAAFGIIVGVSTGSGFGNNHMLFLGLKIIAVFGVVQLIDNLVLQPLIFSKSVKAHPLEIFIVIFAGATIAGVIGMVAAIPVYTILRVIFNEMYEGYKQFYVFKPK